MSHIVSLFQSIGTLLYAIGGILFLVALAAAALQFMGFGLFFGSESWTDDEGSHNSKNDFYYGHYNAMKWARNACIGLALLAGGFFFRSIIVDFVSNASSSASGSSAPPGPGALTNCGIAGAPK